MTKFSCRLNTAQSSNNGNQKKKTTHGTPQFVELKVQKVDHNHLHLNSVPAFLLRKSCIMNFLANFVFECFSSSSLLS